MTVLAAFAGGLARMAWQAVRIIIIAAMVAGLASIGIAVANYTATQGSGTTFASVVISSTHYLANLICDATVGETQCVAVKAGSSTAGSSDPAIVTQISPNSPGLISTGQAVSALSLPVTIASDQSAFPVTTSGTQTVNGTTAAGSGSATNLVTVQGNAGGTAIPISGSVTATLASSAVTNAGTFATQNGPTTTGGLSNYFVQPTAGDNHVVIKAGAGQVYKVTVTNNSATINYLRLYNATTGFNGCGSATNLVYQAMIPANSTNGAGLADSWAQGLAFATGISICVTSGYATNDATNATASAMSVNVGYK